MKHKFWTGAGVVAVGIVAALSGLTSAAASETTQYHGDAEFTTVLWSAAPLSDGSTPWPQQYVQQAPGNNQYVFGLTTVGLACGTFYQSDLYKTVDVPGLIGDGTLNAGEDNGKAIQWTTFTTPACQVVTPPVTTTPEPTGSPTSPVVTSEPTPPTTPPVTTAPVVTPTPPASTTPPGTPPASPTQTSSAPPTVQPTAPQTAGVPPAGPTKPTPRTADRFDASTQAATSLAYTGSNASKPLLIGSLILVIGLILLFGARALTIRRIKRDGKTE